MNVKRRTLQEQNNNYVNRKMAWISRVYGYSQDPLESIKRLKKTISEVESKNRDGHEFNNLESFLYEAIASCYKNIGEYRTAVEYSEKSLRKVEEINDWGSVAHAHCQLGLILFSIGDDKGLLEHCKEGARAAELTYDPATILVCYATLSQDFRVFGDLVNALEYSKQALEVANISLQKFDIVRCMTDLADIYLQLEYFKNAKIYYERALSIARDTKDENAVSSCLIGLAAFYYRINDTRKAIKYAEECIAIQKDTHSSILSDCYVCIASCWYKSQDMKRAIKYFNHALEIERKLGDKKTISQIYRFLGDCYLVDKNTHKKAYSYYEQSIEHIESVGVELVREEHKIALYGDSNDTYLQMISLCLYLGKHQAALGYVERSKSRAFLDILANTEMKPHSEFTEKQESLLSEESKILIKLRELQTYHLSKRKNGLVEPLDIDDILDRRRRLYIQLKEIDEEYVFMRSGKPISFKDMLEIIA